MAVEIRLGHTFVVTQLAVELADTYNGQAEISRQSLKWFTELGELQINPDKDISI